MTLAKKEDEGRLRMVETLVHIAYPSTGRLT
jgi:hypothetical protein